jgi:hypothetical protein
MKPRILKHRGQWYCGLLVGGPFCVGIGYDPAEAYADWKALVNA